MMLIYVSFSFERVNFYPPAVEEFCWPECLWSRPKDTPDSTYHVFYRLSNLVLENLRFLLDQEDLAWERDLARHRAAASGLSMEKVSAQAMILEKRRQCQDRQVVLLEEWGEILSRMEPRTVNSLPSPPERPDPSPFHGLSKCLECGQDQEHLPGCSVLVRWDVLDLTRGTDLDKNRQWLLGQLAMSLDKERFHWQKVLDGFLGFLDNHAGTNRGAA